MKLVMTKTKRPTQKEKIAVYEDLLHNIQLFAEVTMDEERLKVIIARACRWSYSHRAGNGELSEDVLNDRIDTAFWNLDVFKRHARKEAT